MQLSKNSRSRGRRTKSRNVFNQVSAGGKIFDIGHERAMFNKPALIVVAYSNSSATPRGLYEVGFDGSVRLISESNSDHHCNISTDGKWAVASSPIPAAVKSTELDLCLRAPADWVRSEFDYVTSDITIVNTRIGTREFLFHGSNAVGPSGSLQPYEAHPAISPNGRWVLVKDAKERRAIAIELNQEKLQKFLN